MSKPWKQTKIFTADAEQSVIIEPNPERDGVCIHSNEELVNQSFCLYATYDEALAIAEELINFVNLNQNKEDEVG
jgi:hypothetical protein|tara:strand:- start:1322 stop:1546 length:225 start_codon:yes stop_codon:yes gene_type:complete